MAQIISSIKFDMHTFDFERGVTFDNNAVRSEAGTLTDADIPGMTGSVAYNSSALLWSGASSFGASDDKVAYFGVGLAANGAGTPNAGTVRAMGVAEGGLEAALLNVSIDAADIFAASQTATREDDSRLLRLALTGNDRIILSDLADEVASQNGNDVVRGNGGNDSLFGNSGADSLFGGSGDDNLSGGFGFDFLSGGFGKDLIHGDGGRDRIFGNQGADTLYGDAGGDKLFGGYGYDKLYGGAGADRLFGDGGRDVMYGGRDGDVDTFIFRALSDSSAGANRDVIHDFSREMDRIDLSRLDANTSQSGDQAFSFAGQTATAHSVWYRMGGTGLTVFADVNGDTVADFSVRVAVTNGIAAGDFLL